MIQKDRLAISGSGEMAVVIAENAKGMQLESHCFSNNINDKAIGIADYFHNISIFDIERIVNVCKELNVKGVVPTTELTIPVAAKIAEKMRLNGMPVWLSEIVTDKAFVREKAKDLTLIRQPWFQVMEVGQKIPSIYSFPVVVKPTSLGGKRGVSVAYSEEELMHAIQYSVDSMPPKKRHIIIEEFVDKGQEYSVESLSFHGKHIVIQVTEKISSGPPHCVELGHIQPANLSKEMREKIEQAIPELLSAVGVDNTTSHTEIKIVNEDIFLIELNARLGGDHISYPLTELSTGYNYIEGSIHIALNDFDVPDKMEFTHNTCGVIFISKQTQQFLKLFNECEKYPWLYKKSKSTDKLVEIVINHSFDTNYMIFNNWDGGIPEEIKELL